MRKDFFDISLVVCCITLSGYCIYQRVVAHNDKAESTVSAETIMSTQATQPSTQPSYKCSTTEAVVTKTTKLETLKAAVDETPKLETLTSVELSNSESNEDWKAIIDKEDCVMLHYSDDFKVDHMFDDYVSYALSKDKLVSIYFNTDSLLFIECEPKKFADWCIDQTKEYQGKVIYALGYEDTVTINPEWVKDCIEEFDKAGVKLIPFLSQATLHKSSIYGSDENMHTWFDIVDDYPYIWIKDYDPIAQFDAAFPYHWPEGGNYTYVVGHQNSSEVNPINYGTFLGNADRWHELASIKTEISTNPNEE